MSSNIALAGSSSNVAFVHMLKKYRDYKFMMYYTSSKFFDTSPVRLSLTQTMLEDFESPSTVNGQFWTHFYAVKVTD